MEIEDRLSLHGNLQATLVTVSAQALCHYITDDELQRIDDMRQDVGTEICLASAGVFFGSLVPAIEGFRKFSAPYPSATLTDLLSMLLSFASLTLALVTALQWWHRSKRQGRLVDNIRQRPKVPLHLVRDGGDRSFDRDDAC
ncbi:MAG: hypothetical protein JHD35_16165 [Sphingopyxis sp.]|nr:hypothetical protein [Sphingopyxis sp.]